MAKMDNLKPGTRIKYVPSETKKGMAGAHGTILFRDEDGDLAVIFDAPFPGGHNLDGKCKEGHGYWIGEWEVGKGRVTRLPKSEEDFD